MLFATLGVAVILIMFWTLRRSKTKQGSNSNKYGTISVQKSLMVITFLRQAICSLEMFSSGSLYGLGAVLLAACFLFIISQAKTVSTDSNEGEKSQDNVGRQTTVLLFGALGDLATRYLWRGFFQLYHQNYSENRSDRKLRVFAVGRTEESKATSKMTEILTGDFFCKSKSESCIETSRRFLQTISYHKAKSENDYEALKEIILSEIDLKTKEAVRIIYLSVPPFAYPAILEMIHMHLRPKDEKTSLRIVFEKPFGHDAVSSGLLQNIISKYFIEDQIYRVDHYLGKQTVAEIMNFRMENKEQLSKIWNDRYIESIEIVMKECIDCKGRTEFYNNYGVVLDVMQNHLTEVFLRLVMKIPSDSGHRSFAKSKHEALKLVKSPAVNDIIIGQYASYQEHFTKEMQEKSNDASFNVARTSTPTFAAIKVNYNSSSFARTKFLFISGKKLNEKSSFVKINFRPLHKYKSDDSDNCQDKKPEIRYIKFCIHCSLINGPAIEVSPGFEFLNLKLPDGWKEKAYGKRKLVVPSVITDAYSFLIWQIDKGNKNLFIDSESLSESWRIWDKVQNLVKSGSLPLIKYGEQNLDKLSFYHDPFTDGLRTVQDHLLPNFAVSEFFQADRNVQFSSIQEMDFLSSKLVTGMIDHVIGKLVVEIVEGINDAEKKERFYHIALPGGNSVLPLYRKLCMVSSSFKKENMHVWLVDERCVPLNHTKSNFKLLLDNLQSCLQLPYQNLHPLLTGKIRDTCTQSNAVDYEEDIKAWLPSFQFDMVVLGLGKDGHIASIFPDDEESLKSTDFVIVNESGPEQDIKSRATMTLKLINYAQKISVIASGDKKREIVQSLKEQRTGVSNVPVLMVKSNISSVTWYIDDIAYH